MPPENNVVTRTAPYRSAAAREIMRIGAVVVVGDGGSPDTLRRPRIQPVADLTLDIGRRAGSGLRPTLTLPDGTVSGQHARIQRATDRPDLFVVEDLGSTNGTFVNGQRITAPTPLRDGAILFLGSHVLVFRMYTAPELEAVEEDAEKPLTPVPTLSPSMAATNSRLRRLAKSGAEILLVGETGVGKEVYAGAIHDLSGRAGPLVAVNCAAIPRELVESELFGYEKGAHSTAQARKVGLVEAAAGGTLFLDEIGDMPIELQAKLLRFLQDKRFSPLGSTRVVEADVRIVAATSRVALDKGGHVQEALLGRLGAQPIRLLPLRERIEDLGRLCAHFLRDVTDGRSFDADAFKAMMLYDWPLNVRELVKVITEAEVLSRSSPTIGFDHLPPAIAGQVQPEGQRFDDTIVDHEPPAELNGATGRVRVPMSAGGTARTRRPAPTREELETELAECGGSVAEVARRLKRQYAVVWRCIQRYGIDANVYRRNGND
ncbi:MAG TPA: sigma 54-interacting transcriptional regulator [Polyangia bacterium]|nr:sigma 54-interacting transcriptional regulator [Polyangia bacterium]